MPLVTFSYNYSEGDGNTYSTTPVDNVVHKVTLPREAHNRRWWLRSVQASSVEPFGTNTFFRWIDVKFPELMPEDHVMYSLNSEGNTSTPSRGLRFYVNAFSQDQRNEEPSHYAIVSSPNINMGTHRLDSLDLNLHITARSGFDGTVVPLYKYSIILEYE
jgi:hypothetical protein